MPLTRITPPPKKRFIVYALSTLVSCLLLWTVIQLVNAATTYIVDVDANVFTSDVITINGNPVFAYYGGGKVKVLTCSNPACETGTSTINIPVPSTSGILAVVLADVSGNPFIAYSNSTQVIAVACTDALCSSAPVITTVANFNTDGYVQAVTVVNGKPLIVYTEKSGSVTAQRERLITAACVDPQCSTAPITTILYDDYSSNWGLRFRAAFINNYPIISFLHANKLKMAVCANLQCTGIPYWRELDSSVYSNSLSMTLLNGNPVMAYQSGISHVKVAACSDPTCQTAPTISSLNNVDAYNPSIANVNGTLMIASIAPNVSSRFNLSTCQDSVCLSVTTAELPISGDNQRAPQMLNVGGFPAFSFISNYSLLKYYYGGDYTPIYFSTVTFTAVPPSATPTPLPTPTLLPTFPALPVPSSVHVLDSEILVGSIVMRLNHQGLPIIAYDASSDIRLLECNNATTCDAPIRKTLFTYDAKRLVSMVLTSQDVPIITYYDLVQNTGNLLICSNPSCDQTALFVLDQNLAEDSLSVTIDSQDIAWVSYFQGGQSQIKVVRCNTSTSCDAPTYMIVPDSPLPTSIIHTILALDSQSRPIIAYDDNVKNLVKLARCESPTTCGSPVIYPIGTPGFFSFIFAMQLDPAGRPVIAYSSDADHFSKDIRLARCENNATCDAVTTTTVDRVRHNFVGIAGMSLDAQGLPLLGYMEGGNQDLRMVRCTTLNCDSRLMTSIDTRADTTGRETVIAVDSSNHVFIAYSHYATINSVSELLLYIGGPIPAGLLLTPTAPPDVAPLQNYFNSTRIVTLTWNRIAGAYGYQVQLDDAPDFITPLDTQDVTADTLQYPTDSLANGTYYWRVCAKNSADICGAWSVTQSFIISVDD